MTEPALLPLFVYGTLREPTVRASVLGARAEHLTIQPATLLGYARLTVPGYAFPFIVPAPDSHVDGEIMLGLHPSDYPILDDYEDLDTDLYARVQVEVRTPDGVRIAWAYVKGPGEPAPPSHEAEPYHGAPPLRGIPTGPRRDGVAERMSAQPIFTPSMGHGTEGRESSGLPGRAERA